MSLAENQYKICVLGDSGVGKTSLVERFCCNTFHENTKSTIGCGVVANTLSCKHPDSGEIIKSDFLFWDTAGQERFSALTSQYYRGASGVIVVFALDNALSFARTEDWVREFHQACNIPEDDDELPVLLIGNKSDLNCEEKASLIEEAKKLSSDEGWYFFVTSAKDGSYVFQAFREFCIQVYLAKQAILRNAFAERLQRAASIASKLPSGKAIVPTTNENGQHDGAVAIVDGNNSKRRTGSLILMAPRSLRSASMLPQEISQLPSTVSSSSSSTIDITKTKKETYEMSIAQQCCILQ